MSSSQINDAVRRSHLCEVWISLHEAEVLTQALEEALVHCSDSLKALFDDIEKATGWQLVRELLGYIASGTPEKYTAINDAYKQARTAAESVRLWDYGKGPYLSLSSADGVNLQGRFAKLSSRCQTVTLTIERANTKFPAKPGEANVPLLRASVLLNPFDDAKFEKCFAFVRDLFIGLSERCSQSNVLVSS